MKKIIFLTVLIFSINNFAQNKISTMKILPYPQNMKVEKGFLKIDEGFTAQINFNKNTKLIKAANRFLMELEKRTGIFLEYPLVNEFPDSVKPAMVIDVKRIGKVKLNENESYSLTITNEKVLLKAETDIGAIRGLATLIQLLQVNEQSYCFPNIEINDSPRFPWRGLMIDVCRHFMPINVIKRNLDGMTAAKMNVFHWHLSEDQGFRIECKTFPKLHELGSRGDYYTQEQVKDIINYAADRGIRVIPEFDIPGHATSWLVAYPELASAPGPYEVDKYYGIKNPTINPTIEKTYEFFDKFFAEMSKLFPDEYIHIGGDENNGKQWNANPEIQKFMKSNNIKDNHELQAYFNRRILGILTKYNKKMIGWDEILHKDIPNNIVIQSWRGKKALVKAAKNGYQGILSNGYYIDLMQPTEYHYLNDPVIENANLTKEEEKRILGGEATMWTEWVTQENMDSRIWPRTAAIAERLWSPANVKDVDDMFSRLDKFSLLLEDYGLTHISYQEKMLRRLVNGRNTQPLKTLVDVVEPLQEYKRAGDARKNGKEFSQFTPFTRVVDAANVDSKIVLTFNKLVDKYVLDKDPNTLKSIKNYLSIWAENHNKLLPIIKKSPILLEVEPLSKDLSTLAELSLKGLSGNVIKSNDEKYLIELEQIANKSKNSYGQVELVVVDAIEKLFGISENK